MDKGQKPSDEETFYLDWAQDALKDNLILINDILRQFLTISAALLGVSIFYEKIIVDESIKLIVISLFFISLVLSILGIIPYGRKVDLMNPYDFKLHKKQVFFTKLTITCLSSITLISGFSCIIYSLYTKQ